MKLRFKIVGVLLTLALFTNALIPAMAQAISETVIEPYGMIDEQFQTQHVKNGKGQTQIIASYSQVNVSTNSLYLLSSDCYPYGGGAVSHRAGEVQPNKKVFFYGTWSATGIFDGGKDCAIYSMTHQY